MFNSYLKYYFKQGIFAYDQSVFIKRLPKVSWVKWNLKIAFIVFIICVHLNTESQLDNVTSKQMK